MPPRKAFQDKIAQAVKLAGLKAARFPDDNPAKKLRRMAEGIVLPERFNHHYLGHYFRCEPATFHLDLYRALETERRTVVRAPRSHAKTTVLDFAYTTHQVACARELRAWVEGTLATSNPALDREIRLVMAEELGRRRDTVRARVGQLLARATPPTLEEMVEARNALAAAEEACRVGTIPLHWDPYIQVISVTVETAEEFTAAVKLELLENPLLRADWGVLMIEKKADATGLMGFVKGVLARLQRKDRDWVSTTDVRVKAFGLKGNIRGGKHKQWRPTLAIIDDPDSEETVSTLNMRERQTRKITAAINYGLQPGTGRVIMIGTPVHADCQVCRFSKPGQYQRWHKLRYKAIREDGTPLWPQWWSLEALRAEEADDPEAFAMEMMDVPPSLGKPVETICYYKRAEYAHLPLFKVLAFDPSMGRSETSDFQALVVLRGPTAAGQILVHRAEFRRIGDPLALMEWVNSVVGEEVPDESVIETIGFQATLEAISTALAQAAGMVIPWLQIPSQGESKDLRVRGMASAINRGLILFPDDGSCRQLELQLLDYPDGKKDGPDVLQMAYARVRYKSLAKFRVRHHPRPLAAALARELRPRPRANAQRGASMSDRVMARALAMDGPFAQRRVRRGDW